MTNIKFREKIFSFYGDNSKICDQCYELAENANIGELYEDITDKSEINLLYAKSSIVLITANKYEKNILHMQVNNTHKKIKRLKIILPLSSERFRELYAYWFEYKEYSILHIHSNITGAYTIGGAADITRWVISNNYLFPNVIISYGICFGTNEKECELGDVIISKKIYPYFMGAKLNDKHLYVDDNNVFSINGDLNNNINSLIEDNKFNNLSFKVKFGNYITGEAVVSSQMYRDKFVNITKQQILAGEMEGYGVFKECMHNGQNIPCMLVKSICDWGVDKNFNIEDEKIVNLFRVFLAEENNNEKLILGTLKDRLQAYAAYCAFQAFKIILDAKIFNMSIFSEVHKILDLFNGNATSCEKIRNSINEIVKKKNLKYNLPSCFVHKCILDLKQQGIIECEPVCYSKENILDDCVHPNRNSTIKILKGSIWEEKINV